MLIVFNYNSLDKTRIGTLCNFTIYTLNIQIGKNIRINTSENPCRNLRPAFGPGTLFAIVSTMGFIDWFVISWPVDVDLGRISDVGGVGVQVALAVEFTNLLIGKDFFLNYHFYV